MGFNLEHISDDILPFLAIDFLTFPAQKIGQFNIELKGFIKMGGVKRKYIETILETMLDPSMCWIVLTDGHKLTNQSYLYKKMI